RADVRPRERHAHEDGVGELRLGEGRAVEVGVAQVRAAEVRPRQARASEVAPDEAHPREVDARKIPSGAALTRRDRVANTAARVVRLFTTEREERALHLELELLLRAEAAVSRLDLDAERPLEDGSKRALLRLGATAGGFLRDGGEQRGRITAHGHRLVEVRPPRAGSLEI